MKPPLHPESAGMAPRETRSNRPRVSQRRLALRGTTNQLSKARAGRDADERERPESGNPDLRFVATIGAVWIVSVVVADVLPGVIAD